MNYCSSCGEKIAQAIPQGDNRLRHVCSACGEIHYQNPRNVVGCLLEWQQNVLLCKRGIEPRKNFWTLPAGFMENGETAMQGAARESQEEARASAEQLKLYSIFNLPRINQVYIMYRGVLGRGHYEAAEETLEADLFSEQQIPWDELAFPIVTETLKNYFVDRKAGVYPIRSADIVGKPGVDLKIIRHV